MEAGKGEAYLSPNESAIFSPNRRIEKNTKDYLERFVAFDLVVLERNTSTPRTESFARAASREASPCCSMKR